MDGYFALLVDSDLPFGPWALATMWVVLFVVNSRIARAARAANDAQKFISVGDRSALLRSTQPRFMLGQVLFAGVVFSFAALAGGPVFVFLAGGLVVAIAWAVGANTQSILSARAMSRPGEVSGSLAFSTSHSYRQLASRCASGAIVCCLVGAILAHLALFGGALILGSTGIGFLRRARRAEAKL